MATAIDTSVLIEAEHGGSLDDLPTLGEGPFYVPPHAAAEFLMGVLLVKNPHTASKARRFYEDEIRPLIDVFGEVEAERLASLNVALRQAGQSMGFYDATIAATVLARQHTLMTADDDFDRVPGLDLVKI